MDKRAAIHEVEVAFKDLVDSVEGLDERAMSRVFYGSWSAKDILAHITGWHIAMTDALERMARGERPTPEGVDYSDVDAWNAKFAAGARALNATTVVAGLKQSFANYVRAAHGVPEDRFGEGKTVNRLLETSGNGHYREHAPALRELKAAA